MHAQNQTSFTVPSIYISLLRSEMAVLDHPVGSPYDPSIFNVTQRMHAILDITSVHVIVINNNPASFSFS